MSLETRLTALATRVAEEVKLKASTLYIHSRGTDLITNGTGLLGDNTNFSWSTFDPTDAPIGSNGSFQTSTNGTRFSDEFIPVDTGKAYQQSVQIRQQVPGVVSRAYVGLAPYDAQKNVMFPQHYVYQARTMTTLAQPLNPGDTTLTLTSVPAGDEWTRIPAYKYVGLWNWVDPAGRVWPQATYTRNVPTFTSITGNVITLAAPYAGAALPAGTPVSRNYPGGNYLYTTAVNVVVSETWTQYKSPQLISGIFNGESENTNGATYAFPPGCAFVKILVLDNYGGAAGGRQAYAGFSLSDASGAKFTADLARTESIALGRLPVAASGTSSATSVVRADDSRLSDARTPTSHTHVATTDLTATGTKSSSTFLRGDNTWAVPPDTNTTYSAQSQAEAENSADTTARLTTGQRMYQAIAKWSVLLAGTQTITGAKTFSIPPAVAAVSTGTPASDAGNGSIWYDTDEPGVTTQTDAAALTTGTLAIARLPSTVVHRVHYTAGAWPARPTGATCVEWVGPVAPAGMLSTDSFVSTA